MSGVTLLLDESLLEEYFSTTRVASRKQLIRTNSKKGPQSQTKAAKNMAL
jgi:hypothetical protein